MSFNVKTKNSAGLLQCLLKRYSNFYLKSASNFGSKLEKCTPKTLKTVIILAALYGIVHYRKFTTVADDNQLLNTIGLKQTQLINHTHYF